MRRSAAPSRVGICPKFIAPYRQSQVGSAARVIDINKENTDAGSVVITTNHSGQDVGEANAVEEIQPTKRARFESPTSQRAGFETPTSQKAGFEAPTSQRARFETPTSQRARFETPTSQKARFETPTSQNARFETPTSQKTRFEAPTSHKQLVHPKFKSPHTPNTSGENKLVANKENTSQPAAITTSRYLNVVWCKRSNKKHKKWEGDAVLKTCGRSVTLYDLEGKEIGKGSGYKSTDLASLKEDESLPIGGKEILVISVLTEDEFRSGKCFTGSSADHSTHHDPVLPSRVSALSKSFNLPMKPVGGVSGVMATPDPVEVKPRHDPTLPGALVMPRPNTSHQWRWNKKELTLVDVVVDPYLSQHLRPHQRLGVLFLYECIMGYRNYGGQGAILADDMGLGKTLQCITLVWTLYKQGPYGGKPVAKKILIITPGSLVKNWHQEFKKWLGTERIQVFAVSASNKVEDFLKTSIYPVLVISYEMFVRMYDSLKQINFDLIICDEGHRLKNTTIKTTSLIMSMSSKRRVVLTGTPIQNDLQEFFSIVEFCNPGVLGSMSGFKRVFEDPIVASRQTQATPSEMSLGKDRAAELSRTTQMFVLRRTNEINNQYLPPKCEIVVFCRPTSLQLRLYDRLLHCQLIRRCLLGGLGGGAPHLICIGALKQLCNHPALLYKKAQAQDNISEGGSEDFNEVYTGLLPLFPENYTEKTSLECYSGKLFVLSQLLHRLHSSATQEKIVIVSNHTKTLDLIQDFCSGEGYAYLRLDGQTPTAKRQELVQRFNIIFLLSSKAGGVGLNLIGASRLLLYDIDWNPAIDLQAMARVWRDGQKKKVHIYRLLTTGSIEEKIYQRQISKQSLSGAVMEVGDKQKVQFSMDDLRDLFSINLHTDCDTHDLLNCDCQGHMMTREPAVKDSVHRACQLGARPLNQKKNLGMDELMDWKHHPSSVLQEHQDWYLEEAEEGISFLFHSEHGEGN